jgi:hypothetical protein
MRVEDRLRPRIPSLLLAQGKQFDHFGLALGGLPPQGSTIRRGLPFD